MTAYIYGRLANDNPPGFRSWPLDGNSSLPAQPQMLLSSATPREPPALVHLRPACPDPKASGLSSVLSGAAGMPDDVVAISAPLFVFQHLAARIAFTMTNRISGYLGRRYQPSCTARACQALTYDNVITRCTR